MPSGVYIRTEKIKLARKNSKKVQEQLKKAVEISSKRPRTEKQMTAYIENGKKSSEKWGFGETTPSWRGGVSIGEAGYVMKYCPNHPYNVRRYVPYHRLLVEEQISRYLLPTEQVHHEDRNPSNNEISNLIAFTSFSAHMKWHHNPSLVKPEEIIFDGRKLKNVDDL